LLDLKVNSKARCGDIQSKAEARLKDVEVKIKRLEAIKRVLRELVQTCHREQTTDHCPILQSLEEER
ncbi:MAG: heavy metal-responsive transcriptional regulator, partial [Deltaproteobacteria bacterium]|nr:heavy metal-responsive transcriptional regulator [Deltaproteobacteria bacterium]